MKHDACGVIETIVVAEKQVGPAVGLGNGEDHEHGPSDVGNVRAAQIGRS